MRTSHGHQIVGTPETPLEPNQRVARCGGPGFCTPCSREHAQATIVPDPFADPKPFSAPFVEGDAVQASRDAQGLSSGDAGFDRQFEQIKRQAAGDVPVFDNNIPWKARQIVYEHIAKSEKMRHYQTFSRDEVYIVWFCKTLQNWKALISTTLPDDTYYEVTYNGDKSEAYLDAYVKQVNVVVHGIPS